MEEIQAFSLIFAQTKLKKIKTEIKNYYYAAAALNFLHAEKHVEVGAVAAAVLAAPLPRVTVVDGVGRPGRLLVAVVEYDDTALLAAVASNDDLLEGVALALHFLPDVVVPHPFERPVSLSAAMASCSFTERSAGSVFGLTRREEEAGGEGTPPSLMTRASLHVRRPSGISRGSRLTGRSVGDPNDVVSMRLDVHELPRRREKEGAPGTPTAASCRPRCTRGRHPACSRGRPTIGVTPRS